MARILVPEIVPSKVARREGKRVSRAINDLANCPKQAERKLLKQIAGSRMIEAVNEVRSHNAKNKA